MASFDYLMYKDRAVEFLSQELFKGTVVLVLGAGVSISSGLPNWHELTARLCRKANLDSPPAGGTADLLQRLAEQVRREYCKGSDHDFAQLVKSCLYDGMLSPALMKDELLIALGALMIGSRRGTVRRVITVNFDSILEWYLTLHGFVPTIVSRPPVLEGAEDVRIYHPHGFLAHSDLGFTDSDFVILGAEAINMRLGTQGDAWWELMRHLLRTGTCLFVGLSVDSFRDRALAPLLTTVGKELEDKRPTGFWLMPGAENDGEKNEFLANNIVPYYYGGHDQVPGFLLSICRKAADGMMGKTVGASGKGFSKV